MKPILLLALATIAASTVFADPIFTSTCTAEGIGTVTGTTSCSISNPGFQLPASYASSSASVQISQNTVVAQGVASAYAGGIYVPGQLFFGPTTASTSVSFSEQLITVGPARPGFLLIAADGDTYEGGGFTARFMGVDGPGIITDGISCGNCAIHAAPPFAFALGQPFTLSFRGGASWGSSPNEGGSSSGSATFTFKFTELDGTPVDVMTTTPEPATWGLLGLSLGAMALLRKGRRC